MRTFIVEDVLWGFNGGTIIVKAENEDEAIRLIKEQYKYDFNDFYKDCGKYYYEFPPPCYEHFEKKDAEGCLRCKMRELDENEVIFDWGGD